MSTELVYPSVNLLQTGYIHGMITVGQLERLVDRVLKGEGIPRQELRNAGLEPLVG